MSKSVTMLVRASAIAIAMAAATPAFAQETRAGQQITNTVTVNYKVENIAQDAVEDSVSFKVDRKINLTVAEDGSATTSVTPGQTNAITTFIVTNSSNADIDIGLSVTQLAGGTAEHGGNDTVTLTNVRIYVDNESTGTVGSWDAGDALVTHLDEVVQDDSARVFVMAEVPSGLDTGDVAGIRLVGTALEGGSTDAGAAIAETEGANTEDVDTVFADDFPLGGDGLQNGSTYGGDDYTVLAAALTAVKSSLVISDPLNGTTDPKMIPGATVEYCVAVTNAAGSALATNIVITDNLPTETSFEPTYGVKVDGTVTDGACNEDGTTATGAYADGTVTAPLSDIPADTTRTVKFRVTVN